MPIIINKSAFLVKNNNKNYKLFKMSLNLRIQLISLSYFSI